MSDQKESKASLLGELESIKSLLTDEELAAVPTLEDKIDTADPSDPDDPPTLTSEFKEQINRPSPSLFSGASETSTDTFQDATTDDIKITDLDLGLLARNGLPGDSALSSSDNNSIEDSIPVLTDARVSPESELPSTPVDAPEETSTETIADLEDEHEEQDLEFSEEDHEDSSDDLQISNDDQSNSDSAMPEPYMAPDALPGQQSLFDAQTKSSKASEIKPDKPAGQKKLSKKKSAPDSKKNKTKKLSNTTRTATIQQGENPFLPKHIKDRLHTQHNLMDTIKADIQRDQLTIDANATQASSDKKLQNIPDGDHNISITLDQLEDLVDKVVTDRLEMIREEITQSLLQTLNKEVDK